MTFSNVESKQDCHANIHDVCIRLYSIILPQMSLHIVNVSRLIICISIRKVTCCLLPFVTTVSHKGN